jgi:hypothetical protein
MKRDNYFRVIFEAAGNVAKIGSSLKSKHDKLAQIV